MVKRRSRTYLLLGLALCLSKMSAEQEEAAILCGAADAQNEQLGLPWETWISDGSEETQAALRQSMHGEAFEIAYAYGRGLALDQLTRRVVERQASTVCVHDFKCFAMHRLSRSFALLAPIAYPSFPGQPQLLVLSISCAAEDRCFFLFGAHL